MNTAVQSRPAAVARQERSTIALSALVFGAGTGSLAVEICASRLLAPYYGSSTIVWANLIGLVLLALSLGYWLGGRLADRHPSARLLGGIVIGSAAFVALIPFVTAPILDVAAVGLDELSAGAVIGSFFATLFLFSPPVLLLGMVAPFAIRLAIVDVGSAGAIAGRFYALSTAGSLVGTFFSALVGIPAIGTQRTLLVSAAILAVTGSILLGRRWLLFALALGGLLALPPGAVKASPNVIYEDESRYQFIQVRERNGVRRLYLNEGIAVHSLWRADAVLTGGVWDTFLVLPPLLGRPAERLAILGNAGGTTARAFGVFYPQVAIDGVEIDPAVTRAGRRLLGLGDNPRLRTHDADARPFLRRTNERYDLVFVDAYHQPYVPFYLATREFFSLVRERLEPGGLIALNVATVPGDRRLARDLAGTLATEFPQVWTWQPLRFNQLVIGLNRPTSRAELQRQVAAVPTGLGRLGRLFARQLRGPVAPSGDPWTDDRAPVEWITDRMIIEFAARDGDLDEISLPTAP
jgi:spermidine synthase